MLLLLFIIILSVIVYLVLRYGFFLPRRKGLRILMYHKVSLDHQDGLTVTQSQLKDQVQYLKNQGYQFIHFSQLAQLIKNNENLDKKVIMTFDDGYSHYQKNLFPIMDVPYTLLLPLAYLGSNNVWDGGAEAILTLDEIKSVMAKNSFIEIGLHSYSHLNYRKASLVEIKKDLDQCFSFLKENGLEFFPVFAYPYGAYPKNKLIKKQVEIFFQQLGLKFALCIGNKVNASLKNPYHLKRIDIRGDDSIEDFQKKIKLGRIRQL